MSTTTMKKNIIKTLEGLSVVRTRLLFDFATYLKDRKAEIEDAFTELSSPRLLKSISAGRRAYKRGQTVSYNKIRKDLGLE